MKNATFRRARRPRANGQDAGAGELDHEAERAASGPRTCRSSSGAPVSSNTKLFVGRCRSPERGRSRRCAGSPPALRPGPAHLDPAPARAPRQRASPPTSSDAGAPARSCRAERLIWASTPWGATAGDDGDARGVQPPDRSPRPSGSRCCSRAPENMPHHPVQHAGLVVHDHRKGGATLGSRFKVEKIRGAGAICGQWRSWVISPPVQRGEGTARSGVRGASPWRPAGGPLRRLRRHLPRCAGAEIIAAHTSLRPSSSIRPPSIGAHVGQDHVVVGLARGDHRQAVLGPCPPGSRRSPGLGVSIICTDGLASSSSGVSARRPTAP